MKRHVTMAKMARERGVNWFVANGQGTMIGDVGRFVERRREHVLQRLEGG
jgi:hypothetical protein